MKHLRADGDFKVFDLGLVDFKDAWLFQKKIIDEVKHRRLNSALILCRHSPVITLGRQADKKNILIPENKLRSDGIQLYEIERGGDVTYHGPGQITVYPIFNLNYLKKDIHWFLRQLEEAAMHCLSFWGADCARRRGLTGVWVGEKKVASIGIAIRNWITFHGLSINIKKVDLANFKLIKPCGMDIEMTSLETVLNRAVQLNKLKEVVVRGFRKTFLFNPLRKNPRTLFLG